MIKCIIYIVLSLTAIFYLLDARAGTPEMEKRCLIITLYGEARGTSQQEMKLVLSTIINRARRNAKTFCATVFADKQYSYFNNDQHIIKAKIHSELEIKQYIDTKYYRNHQQAKRTYADTQALATIERIVNESEKSGYTPEYKYTHYYSRTIPAPKWAAEKVYYYTEQSVFMEH